MKYIVIIIASCLMLIGCEDAVMKNGGLRLSSIDSDKTGVLSTKIGDKEYGLAELSFTVNSEVNISDGIAVMVRTTSATSYYTCEMSVGYADGTNKIFPSFKIETPSGMHAHYVQEFDLTAANFTGDFILGCEVVKEGSKTYLKSYLNRQLMGTYELGSHNNDSILETGKVGFGGLDTVNAMGGFGTNIKITSFSFEG